MRLKNTKAISFLLILAFSLQLTGCLGITNGIPSTPNDTLISLMASVRNFKTDQFLSILMIDKGSSIYREYDEILDLDSYTADAAKCYKSVASNIDVKYDVSSAESKEDIVKVKVTFLIPAWKKLFEDDTFSGPDGICAKLDKADKTSTEMTLRLIKTKDGFKIKNHEDLMDIFDFVGYEIAGLSGEPDPTKETDPSETTPAEPKPTPTPAETTPPETDPSETEPSESEGTAEPKGISAFGEYKKVLSNNKDDIEWFEKTFNTSSCGINDFNGDGVPELFFFSRSTYSDNYVNFSVFTYNPKTQKASRIVLETLTQAGSVISEFFIAKTKDNKLIAYRGYLADGSAIINYNIYQGKDKSALLFTGNLFCSITPTFKDNDGKDFNANVFTATGIDKYKEHTSISQDEYNRIEKELLGSTDILISSCFLRSEVSSANKLMSKHKNSGISYADMLKKLSE